MTTSKPEVLITKKFPEKIVRPLEAIARVHQWDESSYDLMPRRELMRVIDRMSAVINQAEVKVDHELLEKGRQLKIIANVSLGVDNMDLNLMTRHRIWATNTPGYFSYSVVEYAIGGIIAITRRLLEADRFVKQGKWNSFQPGRWDGESLTNKTLGIIGMGSIGQSLAQTAQCLGMKIIYHNRSRLASAFPWVPLDELITRSDVVSVHVPYTPDTHEMLAASHFEKMKPGVIVVNTSRGKVMREADLIRFLQSGHIGGAVLDVFAQEPTVPEVLRKMPNVLLTPHVAGGTKAGRLQCYQLAVSNVMEVMQGRPPINPLNNLVSIPN